MRRFESREELAAKIEWEGGILEAVAYGITFDQMPDDKLREVWDELECAYWDADALADEVRSLLPED